MVVVIFNLIKPFHIVVFRTLFTGIERYTFVDPDYAFTDEEHRLRMEHEQQYLDYIKTLRGNRLADEKTRYTVILSLTKMNNIVSFPVLKPETSLTY